MLKVFQVPTLASYYKSTDKTDKDRPKKRWKYKFLDDSCRNNFCKPKIHLVPEQDV